MYEKTQDICCGEVMGNNLAELAHAEVTEKENQLIVVLSSNFHGIHHLQEN